MLLQQQRLRQSIWEFQILTSNPYFQILTFLSQNALEIFRYNIIVYVHPYSLLKLITKPLDIASLVRGIPIASIEWPLIVFPAPFVKGTEKNKRPTHINLYIHTHTNKQNIKLGEQYFSFL